MTLHPFCTATHRRSIAFLTLALAAITFPLRSVAQGPPPPPPPGPMLNEGSITLIGASLRLNLLRYSGTAAQLSPMAQPTLDYTPGDRLKERSAETFYHLGDLDLRLRSEGEKAWTDYDTAFRRKPVRVLQSDATHFVADLAPTLPDSIPLQVTRAWAVEGGEIVLRFTLANRTGKPVHVGGFGVPMVFNNNMNDRTLEQSYAACSFYDPYIGEDAGYVQVVQLKGTGPVLLLVPDAHTPFEAWKPILDHRVKGELLGTLGNDPTRRGMTYEGSYDWMVHSGAFAETDWKQTTGTTPEEWNTPTETVIEPGKTVTYGLRLLVAPSVRAVESTLQEHGRPVAIGVPGYILPQDMDGRLFLHATSPVRSVESVPTGALTITDDGPARAKDWHAYTVKGKQWGRSQLRITYADGTLQTIGYRTIKPETEAVADMGRFLFRDQWFDEPNDPFHRAPSVLSYDNAAGKQLTQEPRVWIAGLSDEGGAGSWLAAAMKEAQQPDAQEVAKLERFVNETVWGHLQESSGPEKFGVHKSLFYYQPDALPAGYYDPNENWKNWTSWSRKDAADVGRTYNYPHVVSAYWSLYHIGRNTTGLVTQKPWQWYLDQAFQTTIAMRTLAPYYTQFGLMEGTIFVHLLNDLKAEGWTDKAAQLETFMHERANHWREESYPFGSEMPWDSTGQEEVYDWTRYFGDDDKALVTVNAILAYTPVVPSWGYNGSSRRYWDFLYGGKYPRIERQLHHYGSGLNAIPLLAEFRRNPADLYLLRAGYGGVMGPLTNIDEKGFASAAFHSFPDRMAFDPYTGDYGPNFLGHSLNTAAYLTRDNRFGWLAFGGNITESDGVVHMRVLDSARTRAFIAPLGLWVTLDAGQLDQVDYDEKRHTVRLTLAAATPSVPVARLSMRQTATGKPSYTPVLTTFTNTSGHYDIKLTTQPTTVSVDVPEKP